MKKFTIFCSVVIALVLSVLIALSSTTVTYELDFANANAYRIYMTDTTVAKKEISKTSDDFADVTKLIEDLLTSSLIVRNISGDGLDTKVVQDLSGKFENYSSSVLRDNFAVAIDYTVPKEQKVYYQGDSKVITHYGYLVVLGKEKKQQEIKIYYRTSSSTSTYQNNPMVVKGDTTKLINYIENYA